MDFEVKALPYSKDALTPHMSAETLEFHYEKHHKGYMKKLDAALTDDLKRRQQSLEQIVKTSTGKVFNCAAQVWNHTFYWNSLSPEASQPSAELSAAIEKSFGSFGTSEASFDFNRSNDSGSASFRLNGLYLSGDGHRDAVVVFIELFDVVGRVREFAVVEPRRRVERTGQAVKTNGGAK